MLLLRINQNVVGRLSYADDLFTFEYSDWFKASGLRPLIGLEDVNKIHRSKTLWAFFEVRIPSPHQPAVLQVIEEEGINATDSMALLKRFGRWTIKDPFELCEIRSSF